jgi:hypothetical protein
VDGQIDFAGGSRLTGQARLITLSSERLTDNNSLTDPKRVTPNESVLDVAGDHFSYKFPANSLTIIRTPIEETETIQTNATK